CNIKVTFSQFTFTTPFAGLTPLGAPPRVTVAPVSESTPSRRRRPHSTSDGVRPAFTLIEPCPVPASLERPWPRSLVGKVRPAFTLITTFIQCWNVRMVVSSSGPGNNPQAHRDIVIAADPSTTGFSGMNQLIWTSRLEVPGASGQVVVNGTTA